MSNYIFDKTSYVFKNAGRTVWSVLKPVVHVFLWSVAFSVIFYIALAILVSTDEEKRLRKELRTYEKVYPEMEARMQLLEDAIDGLQIKDDEVYREIFHSAAPAVDPINSLDFLPQGDTISDRHIVEYVSKKSRALMEVATVVEDDFRHIFEEVENVRNVPLSLPVDGVTYAQVGASTGQRVSPFLKVASEHRGIDIIVPQGNAVYAAAAGIVEEISRSRKADGNVVGINHGNGFHTRYAHLGDINVVRGQTVRKGQKLGEVGISGSSFAPHLHYEVLRDSIHVDPVNHFFASVNPDEYANMVYMSVHTEQSMD